MKKVAKSCEGEREKGCKKGVKAKTVQKVAESRKGKVCGKGCKKVAKAICVKKV